MMKLALSKLGGQPFKKLREYRSSKRTDEQTTSTESTKPVKPTEPNNKYTKPKAKSIGKSWFG